jgi:hypothetical protein
VKIRFQYRIITQFISLPDLAGGEIKRFHNQRPPAARWPEPPPALLVAVDYLVAFAGQVIYK